MKKSILGGALVLSAGMLALVACSNGKTLTRAEAITKLDAISAVVTAKDFAAPTKVTVDGAATTKSGVTTNTNIAFSSNDYYAKMKIDSKDTDNADIHTYSYFYVTTVETVDVFWMGVDTNVDVSTGKATTVSKKYAKIASEAKATWSSSINSLITAFQGMVTGSPAALSKSLTETPLTDGQSEAYSSTGDGNLTAEIWTAGSDGVKTAYDKCVFDNNLLVESDSLSAEDGETKSKYNWGNCSLDRPIDTNTWTATNA
jgi:hypothetical protein